MPEGKDPHTEFTRGDKPHYIVDENSRIITISGSLEKLIVMVKAIHRARYPKQNGRKLDMEIEHSLKDEMRSMEAYVKGRITREELMHRCIDLPQLTFGLLHRIKFRIDDTAAHPSFVVKYFANDLPGNDHFSDIRANFQRALESV